jgi:hypothetical protein
MRSASTERVNDVQEFDQPEQPEQRRSMSESRPRVMAQPVRRQQYQPAPAPSFSRAAADPGLALAGAPRVPASSRFAQKQSLFDNRNSESSPWGTSAVPLLGARSPLGEAQLSSPAPAAPATRSMILAQSAPATTSYPEIDKILERQAATRPFSQGEAQALLESVQSSLTRVSAPENAGDACIKALPPEALTSATTLKNRLMQSIGTMKSGDTFQATDQEMAGLEKVLECSSGLSAKPSSILPTIGAIVVLGGGVAGLVYLLSKSK